MDIQGSVDQFCHGFREEARDLLVELESVLLELNEHRADAELVGRVFRALHTIKGSGAMFGFDELAAFAHKLENAFDEVRRGHLAVTPELVDLTLSALDRIRAMVDEGEGAAAVDREACATILARLRSLTGQEPAMSDLPSAAVGPPTRREEERPVASDAVERVWRIRSAACAGLRR